VERRREEGDLSVMDVNRIVGCLDRDLTQGVLSRPTLEWSGTFARAIHLVRQHRGLRSLDALHIGHALESGAVRFVTFDRRQSKAATAEGLKVWPKLAG
jgi:hypothetical protein